MVRSYVRYLLSPISLAALLVAGPLMQSGTAWAADQLAMNPAATPTIHLKVDQVRSDRGWIWVELFGDRSEGFLEAEGRVKKLKVNATAGVTEVKIKVPETGVYAIVLYHDENANDDLDQNFIGYPLEGYGFSNNPKLFLAPPSHGETAFQVAQSGAELEIKVTYP